jgi:hypothetical protein
MDVVASRKSVRLPGIDPLPPLSSLLASHDRPIFIYLLQSWFIKWRFVTCITHIASNAGTIMNNDTVPVFAVDGVRARVSSCGICGGQNYTAAGFLRVLRFPLSTSIPPIASQPPSPIIRDWCNRPIVVAVPSRLSLTPLRIKKVQASGYKSLCYPRFYFSLVTSAYRIPQPRPQ